MNRARLLFEVYSRTLKGTSGRKLTRKQSQSSNYIRSEPRETCGEGSLPGSEDLGRLRDSKGEDGGDESRAVGEEERRAGRRRRGRFLQLSHCHRGNRRGRALPLRQ